MARDRGKFNKRGGGGRPGGFDAMSAEEIEIRNRQIAEQEERRAQRRMGDDDSDDDDDGDSKDGEGKQGEKDKEEKATAEAAVAAPPVISDAGKKAKGEGPPGQVTTEYEHKKNMAKLEEVRRRREEAAAKRAIEEEAAKETEEEQKRLAALAISGGDDDSDGGAKAKKKKGKAAIPKLDKIAIKKMKPAQLKEALKERGLDIQGAAKQLTERLLKFEAER
jgi:hypothetical protein